MTAAISTVEDALGLPTPQQLAKTEEGEEGEGEEGGEGREESRGVEALAKLAESKKEGLILLLDNYIWCIQYLCLIHLRHSRAFLELKEGVTCFFPLSRGG